MARHSLKMQYAAETVQLEVLINQQKPAADNSVWLDNVVSHFDSAAEAYEQYLRLAGIFLGKGYTIMTIQTTYPNGHESWTR